MHPSDSEQNEAANSNTNSADTAPVSEVAPLSETPTHLTLEANADTAVEVEDRRASPRRKKLLRVMVRNDSATLEPFTGWILDRSLGGMCVAVDHPIEVGSILAICRLPETVATRWVELRVLNLRERESTWELGCEYLRVPSWEVLLQFE